MVAVVLIFQLRYRLIACRPPMFGKVVNIVGHLRCHLLNSDAAHCGIVWAHGDILKVVKLAENAEL